MKAEVVKKTWVVKLTRITLAEIGGTPDQRKTTPDQPSMADQAHFKGFYADQASWLIRRILVTFYADQE